MKIGEKEIQHVIKLTAFDRYLYFIKKVADRERMWSLISPSGEWVMGEIECQRIFSVWPAPEYASLNIKGNWNDCVIKEIPVDRFKNEIELLAKSEKFLINVFSVNDLTGFVVTFEELTRDLNEELSRYE